VTPSTTLQCLSPIFDPQSKYAFGENAHGTRNGFAIPRRLDGRPQTLRMNRGWRPEYSNSIGPYEGRSFSHHINTGTSWRSALMRRTRTPSPGYNFGAAVRRIGYPSTSPIPNAAALFANRTWNWPSTMGPGHGLFYRGWAWGSGQEMGYLFGQYKRIHMKHPQCYERAAF
jgi:hypothetical protein